jgi:hypothetical protein
MEVSSIGGLLRKDQLLERNCVAAVDSHNFALRIRSRNYFDGILRQFENFCEQPLEFAICRAFDGWSSDPNFQCAIVFAHDLAARRARHNNDGKRYRTSFAGMSNQEQ